MFSFSRASLAVNVVALMLVLALIVLAVGVALARRRKLRWHARVQTCLSLVLLLLVGWLEWDVRTTGWWEYAKASAFFPTGVVAALAIHLVCAVAAVVCWAVALTIAWRNVLPDGELGVHSSAHRLWGWRAVWTTFATAVTAEVFYVLAFVA